MLNIFITIVGQFCNCMTQHETWSFPFAIQTKLEMVYSGHVLFKAKVRQIRQGIYLMIIVTIQNNFVYARGVVELQYSRKFIYFL